MSRRQPDGNHPVWSKNWNGGRICSWYHVGKLNGRDNSACGRTFQVLDSGYPHLSVWLRFHTLFSATR